MKNKMSPWLTLLGIFMLFLLFTFYNLSPLLVDFRTSIYGLIFEKAIIYAIIAYVCFRKGSKLPNICKVILFLFPTLSLALSLLSLGRISYLIILFYSFICVGCYAYYKIKKRKDYSSLMFVGLITFIQAIMPVMMVEYIDSEIPFWLPSLIICLIVSSLAIVFSLKKYNKDKNNPKKKLKTKNAGELVSFNIVMVMAGFLLPWMLLSSLNVVLDTTTPSYETFEIVDKDIDTGPRRVTTYNLELEKGDIKINIAVSELVYYEYEIGDEIVVSIYNGAFKERYYTYDR